MDNAVKELQDLMELQNSGEVTRFKDIAYN